MLSRLAAGVPLSHWSLWPVVAVGLCFCQGAPTPSETSKMAGPLIPAHTILAPIVAILIPLACRLKHKRSSVLPAGVSTDSQSSFQGHRVLAAPWPGPQREHTHKHRCEAGQKPFQRWTPLNRIGRMLTFMAHYSWPRVFLSLNLGALLFCFWFKPGPNHAEVVTLAFCLPLIALPFAWLFSELDLLICCVALHWQVPVVCF